MSITCREDIKTATREELTQYLEGWGFAVYDKEPIGDLRRAALENYDTEKREARRQQQRTDR